jgi:hypothetical protein
MGPMGHLGRGRLGGGPFGGNGPSGPMGLFGVFPKLFRMDGYFEWIAFSNGTCPKPKYSKYQINHCKGLLEPWQPKCQESLDYRRAGRP